MHADFRRLWIGDGLGRLGGSVALLALPVLAATVLEASTWQVTLLSTFAGLPLLVIGLPVGAWADRMRRRPVLVVANLGRAAALAWVPVAAVLGLLTVEQLYIVELLVGVGTVFFDVSQGAYLPALVGRSRLVEANGRLAANHTVAHSAGPSVGGQVVQWLGAPLAVAGAALGFLWSAVWIASIRAPEPPPRTDESRHLTREIRDGLRFVLNQPFIRATTVHATTAVLFLATRYAVEVLFLLRTVGLSPSGIGVLMTISGLGAVAGAATASRIAHLVGRTRTVLLCGLTMGLASLLIPLTGRGAGLVCYALGAGAVSLSITVHNVTGVSLRQHLCPDALLGRMNATSRFLAWATLPLGGLLGGALGTAFGLRGTMWLAAVGVLLSSLWLVLSPACRARDLPGDDAAAGGRAGAPSPGSRPGPTARSLTGPAR